MQFYAPRIKDSIQTIYTVRHFQSEGNAKGMDDSSLKDIPNHRFPLSAKGEMQIDLTARYIRENGLLKEGMGIYTSSFYRTQKSLNGIISLQNSNGFRVIEDPRLDEWWKGIFHSHPKKIIEEDFRHEKTIQEREGWYHYRPPGGQSGKDVEINLLSFFKDITEQEIFILGHGRSIAFMRRILTNMPNDHNCDYPYPKNGEVWKFNRSGDYYNFESLFIPNLEE